MASIEDIGNLGQPEHSTSIPLESLGSAPGYAPTNTVLDTNQPSDHPLHRRSVDVDFFDPSGVAELRRSMSRASVGQHGRAEPSQLSVVSEDTLIPENGPFDLEKVARVFNRK